MKACVIGGGPSGLYISQNLAKYGFDVKLYEKDSSLLGNYKYARDKINIQPDPRIKIHLNSDETAIDDKNCDFYVLATGGKQKELQIDGKNHLINSLDLIKKHYDKNHLFERNDMDICIIGMGNVALDLVHYLKDYVKSITVMSRSNIRNASFDNHVMRDIIDSDFFKIDVESSYDQDSNDRKTVRRYEMFKNYIKPGLLNKISNLIGYLLDFNKKPTLNLLFESTPSSIVKEGNLLKLNYNMRNELKSDVFDAVISSIGFIPNIPVISTDKKVYKIGWCNNSKGNIGDSKTEANEMAREIAREMKTVENSDLY